MNFRQVHLDFHNSEKIPDIGRRFDKAQFQQALLTGHVNSITLFAKCHHGWAYFPSEKNEIHPNLHFDLLGKQIEAAHEIGVKTPIYLSVGFDEKAAHQHPEWMRENYDHSMGSAESFATAWYHPLCVNSPYLDYLLAQIKEVCERYDADGIFLDIISVNPCYCHTCMKELFAAGKSPQDHDAVMELAEKTYQNYVTRVRQTIDEVKPGLPVFHNGGHIRHGRRDIAHGNTHLELESLPTGGWGYDHFPISAAYARTLDMEFLGMTGKFHGTWGEFGGFKHKNALRYEMALDVANGAKCSIGDQLDPSGKMDLFTYENIGAAYAEVEQKEEWLDHAEAVAQIGLLSNEAVANLNGEQYDGDSLTGAGRILLEGKYLFNVIDTQEDFNRYKVIILSDDIIVSGELQAALSSFVQNGGKLLASGKSGLNLDHEFAFDFGVRWKSECEQYPDYIRPLFSYEDVGDTYFLMRGKSQVVELTTGQEFAKHIKTYFNRTAEHFSSHFHTPPSGEENGCGISEGKDGIYIAWNIFDDYAKHGMLIAKRIVCFALDQLLGEDKLLQTNLPAQGVATLMKQKNRDILHLLYGIPTKRGVKTEIIEDLVPLYDISVSIKHLQPVTKVYLAPENQEISFTQDDQGQVHFIVPKVECHQMVVMEYSE